jgi:hypothetical protein
MRVVILTCLLISLLLLSSSAQSQRWAPRSDFQADRRAQDRQQRGLGEFTFVRLRYNSPYGGRRWGGWATDYPKADEQFIVGLRNWCRSSLDIANDPLTVTTEEKDLDLFRYPFIYAVEPGRMELSTADAARLREYLLRGGFLMLDDFWGEYEWQNVQEQMSKVFPEHRIQELSLDHPIFHCYFDINEVVQVPNVGNAMRGGPTHEKGGVVPHYEGIVDEQGRVMVFIARNADNGDAWEWIEQPDYPLKYGLAAYRLGMNLIVYSMTH